MLWCNRHFYVSKSVKVDEVQMAWSSGRDVSEEDAKEDNDGDGEKEDEKENKLDINHGTSTLELRRSTSIKNQVKD